MFDFFIGLINDVIYGLYKVTAAIGFPSYALAIIFITIILKVLLYPLMAKQMKSMMNMQEVQPKLLELQKKYANNPDKLNQEMMKLYKEYDINPMAGCLPLIIQMPILIGLYTALGQYQFEPLEHATFFWVNNLNAPDPLYILPILVGVSMFFQQKASMGKNNEAMQNNQMMKSMLYFMPPMMAFICISLPAGLCLYWSVFSLLGIGQQLIMNKQKEKQMVIIEARRAEEAAKKAEEEAERKRKKKAAMMAKKKKEAAEKNLIEEAVIKEEEISQQ